MTRSYSQAHATDPDLYPRTHYLRQSPIKVTHRFTLVQFACLLALCVITLSSISALRLTLPLFIALLVPVRMTMDWVFDAEHLEPLDANEVPHDEETHWSG